MKKILFRIQRCVVTERLMLGRRRLEDGKKIFDCATGRDDCGIFILFVENEEHTSCESHYDKETMRDKTNNNVP